MIWLFGFLNTFWTSIIKRSFFANIGNIFYRTLELSFMFLLVWYYCTLTIRESILKVNGSRIKGWWRFHHFLSTVVSGVLLVWPNTGPWYAFRQQFMWFNVYISMLFIWNFIIIFFCWHRNKICFFYRCSTVLAIFLPEGCFISIESIRWKT